MGEIKKMDRRQQSPWLMEVEVSNQSRKKVIPETFGDKKSKPKMNKQNRVWQDTSSPSSSLADCKAMTFEYGDALISRDVADNDEFNVKEIRKHDDEKPKKDIFIDKSTYSSNIITNLENEKVENVSVSSELPVAKSKWGVKLRHVVTRDSSLEDKPDGEQPSFYNLKELSKRSRPRSIAMDDQAIKSEKPAHPPLVASRSLDLLDGPKSVHNQNQSTPQDELTSVVQRMKSFGLTKQLSKPKPDIPDTKDKGSPVKSSNKPISLEDLLNYDKQNSSVSVIDRENASSKPFQSRTTNTMRVNENDQQNTSKESVKNISRIKKREASVSSDKKTPPIPVQSASTKTESEKIISPKKTTVFGKMKSFQPRKAISLEELLKLDEKNLSVDVVEKSSYKQNSKSDNDIPNSDNDNGFVKRESDFSELHKKLNSDVDKQSLFSNNVSKTEERNFDSIFYNGSSPKQKKAPNKLSKNLFEIKNKDSIDKNIVFQKQENHTSDVKIKNFTDKQSVIFFKGDAHPETTDEINIEKQVESKALEVKKKIDDEKLLSKPIIESVPFETKIKKMNEKHSDAFKVDSTTIETKNKKNDEMQSTKPKKDSNRYNKLGQIILSNDTSDNGLARSNDKVEPPPPSGLISNGVDSISQSNKKNSETRYNKLGQIILADEIQIESKSKQTISETKSKKPSPPKHEEKLNGNIMDIHKNTVDLSKNSILFDTNFQDHHINGNHEVNGNGHASDNSLSEVNLKPVAKKVIQNDLKDKPLASEKSVDLFSLKKQNNSNGVVESKGFTNGIKASENIEEVLNAKNDKLNSEKAFTPAESSSLFYKQETKLKIDKQEIEVKDKPTKDEKISKKLSNGTSTNQSSVDQTNDGDSKPPINRKVGKLIIMTGDQRNEQLKNKNRSKSNANNDEPNNKLGSANNDEEFKKLHQEGFSLSFMSNELEDDGVPDNFPIPQIVFNEKAITLKSMIHVQKHKAPKRVQFNTSKLVTIHSYPAVDLPDAADNDDTAKTSVDNHLILPDIPGTGNGNGAKFTSDTFPSMTSYDTNYSFDFGSVIQRERQRFSSLDDNATKNTTSTVDAVFDYNTDGDHFNVHSNQDTGQALLF